MTPLSSRAPSRLRWLPAVLCAACSLVNRIDACDPTLPGSREADVRTEGSQQVDGAEPLAALPDRGAFLVFTSATSGTDDGSGPAAIRGVLLDGSGAPQRTCGSDGEFEYAPSGAAGTRADQATVAMPSVLTEDLGIVLWRRRDATGQQQVHGRIVPRAGCAMTAAFAVSDLVDRVERPSVAWLGRGRFAVAWTQLQGSITPEGLARVLQVDLSLTPTFLPTELDPSGAGVRLTGAGNGASQLRVMRLADSAFLAAWLDPLRLRPWFAAFDDRLATTVSPREASDTPVRMGVQTRTVGGNQAAFSCDGSQLFGAWTETDAAEVRRLRGRFFSREGDPLRSPLSADGGSFVLSDVPATEEGVVATASMSAGGFMAVWEDNTLASGRARGVRAMVFSPDGARRFTPLACDATGVDLLRDVLGTKRSPAVARLADRSVMVAFTAEGAQGADRSGTSVRVQSVPESLAVHVR